MREEQRRDGVARPVDAERQLRRAQPEAAAVVGRQQVDGVVRRLRGVQRRDQNGAGPETVHGFERIARLRRRAGLAAGEIVELELVGRDDIGGRHRLGSHELRNAGTHKNTAPDVADHRIAAIARGRIGALNGCHRVENGLRRIGAAHITGQHAIAFAKHAALGDARHDIADQPGVEHLALPLAVAGMVGKLHGMHRPHLDAHPLQREHRGGIADMAVGDVGLDRENIHGLGQ